ncbi:MAG: T9SS type B sorting domain-containing protein [Flavobacterium sp.]|jgi:gliding motility-associated-like protein|uniref:Ig-like domain-containing protein n=1 Tax=Flavobacterium TaxID=237 RepID=UPI0022CC6659|nr:T9SS type B sorting domain-containing protein [Flavobacterium sp.]MCZ8330892.1 T9SS type B sorting domain-containing protein [Flavobacterium sp.]
MYKKIIIALFFISSVFGNNSIDNVIKFSNKNPIFGQKKQKKFLLNNAPVLTATGNQIYCPQTQMKIATDFNIVDDDPGIDAIYVQISSGYVSSQDVLLLTGIHPNITTSWNQTTGKLTLTGVFGQPTYPQIIAAVKDIVFQNNSANPQAGTKTFSITVGQANYLPSNGHYYQYISNVGITWSNAKTAAENSTYYGLQGYLATITAADEAQLSGEQAAGAGWIGGSDEVTEGVWRWMTGPEIGMVFWNGGINGSTPNFANWNNGEPNNANNEDYAHITAPGVGISGSWNDLSNTGEANGDYQPKGYIVEYGGMPGDPVLSISTSTTITIPVINPVATYAVCNAVSINMSATATAGTINWYDIQTGGNVLASGNNFITPTLTTTTTYYIDAFPIGCTTGIRTPITVNVNQTPSVTAPSSTSTCEETSVTLTAIATSGTIRWYNSLTSTTPLFTGSSFTTPTLNQSTTYYIEANNNNCISTPRNSVSITINPKPATIADSEIAICEGTSTTLTAGISGLDYEWTTGETTQSISVSTQGQFSVEMTNGFNCSSTQNFSVNVKARPIISDVIITGNTATILTNSGDFEFSIDGNNFQSSNIFQLQNGGIYTAYVKDRDFCGNDDFPFAYITYPAFFSPNNDGTNDFWTIKGMSFYPNPEVTIFDRYGKVIAFINKQNPIWDGTYNGRKLTADDYWFVAKVSETLPEHKGHFSLIR